MKEVQSDRSVTNYMCSEGAFCALDTAVIKQP